jgi:hypothetical protein
MGALLAGALMLGFAALLPAQATGEPKKANKKTNAQLTIPTGAEDAPGATAVEPRDQQLERMLSRSMEGLKVVQHPDGMRSLDLEGRFLHVMLAVPDGKGGTRMVCTTDHATAQAAGSSKAPAVPQKKTPVLEEK